MEEIKVGEYVRTRGIIGKLVRIEYDKVDISLKWYVLDRGNYEISYVNKPYIEKHSFNIIDLIESGDMTEIEYYVPKYRKRIKRIFYVRNSGDIYAFDNPHCDFIYDKEKNKWLDGYGFNPRIVGVITKEKIQKEMYEVK